MSAGPYTGDTARLIVALAVFLAMALAATAALNALLGPPMPLAVLP